MAAPIPTSPPGGGPIHPGVTEAPRELDQRTQTLATQVIARPPGDEPGPTARPRSNAIDLTTPVQVET